MSGFIDKDLSKSYVRLEIIGDKKGFWTIQWPVTDNKIKNEVTEVFEEVEIVVVTEEENNNEENENEENIE